MVIVMEKHTSEGNVEHVVAELTSRGFDVHRSTGSDHTVLGVVGHVDTIDPREFELMEGVQEVVRVSEPYKLSSRTFRREKTVVKARGVDIGGNVLAAVGRPRTDPQYPPRLEAAPRGAHTGAHARRGGGGSRKSNTRRGPRAASREPICRSGGRSATTKEWVRASEYSLPGDTCEVILCGRGIRAFEPSPRNPPHISPIRVINSFSPLP